MLRRAAGSRSRPGRRQRGTPGRPRTGRFDRAWLAGAAEAWRAGPVRARAAERDRVAVEAAGFDPVAVQEVPVEYRFESWAEFRRVVTGLAASQRQALDVARRGHPRRGRRGRPARGSSRSGAARATSSRASRSSRARARGSSCRARSRRARRRARRRVLAVEDRVHLDDLDRAGEARLGDELEREVRLAVGEAAAHRRADARARPPGRARPCRARRGRSSGPAMCVSDSRIARSIPIRSMSLIVYALIPSSRIRSRSRGSSRRRPTSATRSARRPAASSVALEAPVREPDRRGQRHPVHVPGRRGLGRVQVAVRVDPEHAAEPARLREPAERADRDRVVAAEDERQRTLLQREADEPRDPPAGRLDLRQVAGALVGPPRSPRARPSRRRPSRARRSRSRSAARAGPRSGSPRGPCRRRAGRRRGRAPRR